MIKQPAYGSRNVNDSYYKFEARMIEKMNAVMGDVELTKAEEKTDRKSTRLNSSHL